MRDDARKLEDTVYTHAVDLRRRQAESTARARQRHAREGRRDAITRDSRVPYCLTTYPTVSRRFNLNRP